MVKSSQEVSLQEVGMGIYKIIDLDIWKSFKELGKSLSMPKTR